MGTYAPHTFTTYQRIGQHGSGDSGLIGKTRLAMPEDDKEAAELLAELRQIYAPEYELRVVRKITRQHDETRRADLARMNRNAAEYQAECDRNGGRPNV